MKIAPAAMQTPPPTSPRSIHEPGLAIVAFWLVVLMIVPAFDILFSVSLNRSFSQFTLAAIAAIATLTTITLGTIRYVGFRKSPVRFTIMLILTTLFAIMHGLVIANWIANPDLVAPTSQSEDLDLR